MASKTIGVVNVRLGLQSAAFGKGIKTAQTQLQSFAATVSKTAGTVAKFGAAALAAGAVGMVALTKKAAAAQDELAKMSDSLGIQLEQLAGLKLAGSLAGVEIDQLASAIAHMQRAIEEGDPALDKLGLGDLRGKSTIQQLGAIADGMRKLGTASERTDTAMEIFGKTGRRMLSFLRVGSTGFAEATATAKELGTAISRLDAAQIEAMNDSFTLLKESAMGLGTTLAKELGGPIALINLGIVEMTKGVATLGKTFRDMAVLAGGALADLADRLQDVFEVLDEMRGLLTHTVGRLEEFVGGALSTVGGIVGSDTLKLAGSFGQGVGRIDQAAGFNFAIRSQDRSRNVGRPSDVVIDWLSDLANAASKLAKEAKHSSEWTKEAAKDLSVPWWKKMVDDFEKLSPSNAVPFWQVMLHDFERLKAITMKPLEPDTTQFGIGFRSVSSSDIPFISNRTIFGEQQGEMLSLEKQQTALLERIAVGVENVGELN